MCMHAACMYLCKLYICICIICIYVCMHVCMYLCMYICIRDYGSTLYVGMAWKKKAAHTFQLEVES